MKAMILAAGEGRRLRPLTENVPKPLLLAGGQSLIEHHIVQLKQAGVTDIIINVCYLPKKMMEHLGDGQRFGVEITYSFEKNVLGTGGGIKQALSLLGPDPFLLVSADVWSEYSYSEVMFNAQSEIHLVLVDNPPFHSEGDYALGDGGYITTVGERYTYSGIAKIHPKIFAGIKEAAFSFSPLIDHAIEHHGVTGEIYHGPWFNVGTLEELKRLRAFFDSSAQPLTGEI